MSRDELLSPTEAAEWLHVKPQTLAAWRCSGRGPKHQPVCSRVFYRASDIQRWLDEQQAHPEARTA